MENLNCHVCHIEHHIIIAIQVVVCNCANITFATYWAALTPVQCKETHQLPDAIHYFFYFFLQFSSVLDYKFTTNTGFVNTAWKYHGFLYYWQCREGQWVIVNLTIVILWVVELCLSVSKTGSIWHISSLPIMYSVRVFFTQCFWIRKVFCQFLVVDVTSLSTVSPPLSDHPDLKKAGGVLPYCYIP